jgi:hypothetical protein
VAKKVFISYRRDDTKAIAGRVYDRLVSALRRDNVFFDVSAIKGGENFEDRLSSAVTVSDAVLIFIGSKWLEPLSNGILPGLADHNDYVRLEVRQALQQRKLVIPILVDGVVMPDQNKLPEDIATLTKRNALPLRHETFDADLDLITQTALGFRLSEHLASDTRSILLKILHTAMGALAGLALCVLGAIIHQQATNRPLELSIGAAATTVLLVASAVVGAAGGLRLGRRRALA